ncbi:hypothetical protein AURANDRAFT_67625 [Aureococcus anophagefferens]|uniref:Uncharacterized protein n=1 Tax=Aureococcus anophagefferens TaxID=44056 RepID=F0YLP5_AURAN|nr:hypothetical protein AURANDRAFT_67625 [Aureococcus anophagefferens]EGB03946.1 hypothetical protein AURANDRAFT_67625 [Aureococcus anophagefferens]|eukprot:XP_009041370.1 hypothetical protein AURANDRAFT_67625 [Aureococcus anophagefferens]
MRTRGAARSESTTVSPEDTTTTTRLRKRSATGSAQVEKIQAPRQYLDSLLRNHVDPPYAPALDLFQKPQPEQVAGYTLAAMDAVRNGTWTPAVGRADAANKFGVTVLHKACRAQSLASVETLLEAGARLSSCDAGRVPLHDAVWTTEPNFELVGRLVEEDATQLFRLDTRGFSALDYAPQETWPAWCAFLDRVKRELRAALKQSASPLAAAASPLVPFAHNVSPTRKKASRAVPPAAPGAAARPAPSPDSPPPPARPEDAAAMARVLGACGSQGAAQFGAALRPSVPSGDTPPDGSRKLDDSGTWWNLFSSNMLDKLPRSSLSPTPEDEAAKPPGDAAAGAASNDENSPSTSNSNSSTSSPSAPASESPAFSISPATLTRVAAATTTTN